MTDGPGPNAYLPLTAFDRLLYANPTERCSSCAWRSSYR